MCRSRFASVMDHTGPGKLLLVAWPKRYLAKTSIMRQNITPSGHAMVSCVAACYVPPTAQALMLSSF